MPKKDVNGRLKFSGIIKDLLLEGREARKTLDKINKRLNKNYRKNMAKINKALSPKKDS